MSIQIIVESQNATKNIQKSRMSTNVSNLEEDRRCWNKIAAANSKDAYKTPSGRWQLKDPSLKSKRGKGYKTNKELSDIVNKIQSRIELNAEYYSRHLGFEVYDSKNNWIFTPETITFHHIQSLVSRILNADEIVHIDYGRTASRQSIDELVQLATIEEYIGCIVEKLSSGQKTIDENGEFTTKKRKSSQKTEARSLDGYVPSKDIYLFCKYSGPIGSSTSEITPLEVKGFIEQAKRYIDKHPTNSTKFAIQIDGLAGELHLDEYNSDIGKKYSSRMFAGNSEQIITWINKQ